MKEEIIAWVKTLVSAAVYAILIVTFGFQVARVEGQSMAPTLEDQDRLIVNKLAYRIGEPRRGDIVMLYYPLNPEKSFVKRVIAEESDTVRIATLFSTLRLRDSGCCRRQNVVRRSRVTNANRRITSMPPVRPRR